MRDWEAGRLIRILAMDQSGAVAKALSTAKTTWEQIYCSTGHEVLRALRHEHNLDLVLLAPSEDWTGAAEVCRNIKFDSRTAFLPVIFLLPQTQAARAVEAFEAGADDCLPHTASQAELMIRLRKAILFKRASDSLEDATAVITALANAIEGKDHYTCGHTERVGMYAMAVGRRCRLSLEDLATLKTGGIVHDIGKIGVPDHILNKPGKLSDEEFAIMQRHPVIGHDILKPMRTFQDALPVVRWHHEKPNGKGYPDGLSGELIPILPRVIAVADVFDALSTDRPYRKAFDLAECQSIMRDSAEQGELDGELVQVLFQVLEQGLLSHSTAA